VRVSRRHAGSHHRDAQAHVRFGRPRLQLRGIGATPDDHTRQCAADALGLELVLHPDAEAAIRSRTDHGITPQRLKMGEFPRGSRIIPIRTTASPGFPWKTTISSRDSR